MDHLLFHCMVARDIWLFVLVLFGVSWVMPKMLAQMLMECGPFVRLVDNTKQFGWNAIGRLLMDMNGQLIGSNNHCYDAFLIEWLTYEKLGEFVYVCLWWVKVFRGFVNLGLNVVEERVRAQNWLGFDDF